jgi:predicted lipoprotein
VITRREWLSQTALAGVWLTTGACKRTPPTRPEVLEALVLEQAVPDMRALPGASSELSSALQKLAVAPSSAALSAAQSAFRAALLAWQRAQTFRSGPLVESNAFLRAAFWPVRAANLEQLVTGDAPLDAARVEALGVDAKGLFALERLLWERPRGSDQGWLEGPHALRARRFAALLAEDITVRARAALSALGDGRSFARSFAADGQAALTRLITQNVETLESIAVDRLQRALALHEQGRLRLGELPADFSGLSLSISYVQLEALHAQYKGRDERGLGALVAQAAPQIAPHIEALYQEALGTLRGLERPMAEALVQSPAQVQRALERVKALEIAYKAELSSALAVTLSLVSGDGD